MNSYDYRNTEEFLRNKLYTQGKFDFPFIYKQDISKLEKTGLIAFDKTKKIELLRKNKLKAVHFFLDDYKFDEVWNYPSKYLARLGQYKAVMTPDFSTYTNMPVVLQVYNTFRNRWCGAYWQKHGLKVIPTIGWGDPESYDYCFDGIQQGSTVAVSTVGNVGYENDFMKGYRAMIEHIKPVNVINYGATFEGMNVGTELIEAPYVRQMDQV